MVLVPKNVHNPESDTEESDIDKRSWATDQSKWWEVKVNPYETIELALPESIYTAVLLIPAAFEAKQYGCLKKKNRTNLFIVIQVWCLFLITLCFQVTFTWYIKVLFESNIGGDREEEFANNIASHSWDTCSYGYTNQVRAIWRQEYATDFFLRVLCLMVFAAYCIADVYQSMWMLMWLFYLPNSKDCGVQRLRTGPDQEDKDLVEVKNGLPCWLKIFNTQLVLIPKLSVAAFLLCYGSGFLLAARTNEDVILNSLALVFVIELDEYMYGYGLPLNIKNYCEAVPPVIPNTDVIERYSYINGLFGMTWNFLLLATATYALYRTYCRWPEGDYISNDIFFGG